MMKVSYSCSFFLFHLNVNCVDEVLLVAAEEFGELTDQVGMLPNLSFKVKTFT